MIQNETTTQVTWPNGNWANVLDGYAVQFLILDRYRDSGLLSLFQTQPGWAVDFEDEETLILTRATPVPPTTTPMP